MDGDTTVKCGYAIRINNGPCYGIWSHVPEWLPYAPCVKKSWITAVVQQALANNPRN